MESILRMEAVNPYYTGLRIVDCDDFSPHSFGKVELDAIYYSLIRSDSAMELITEWPTFEEINDFYNPGTEDVDGNLIFEAITVDKFNRTEKRMLAVVRTFNKHLKDSEITALPPVVGNPRRSGAFAYATVQLPFSDGQVVSVIFHSPEGDRKRIAPDDTIIAFRWLLNKRDITHVVAPEEGREVSLETIAKRLTQLVVKNSARFEKQQKAAMEERKALDEAREALRAAEDRQVELMDGVGAAVKEVETYEARLSATLTALEKQRTINAELQAKIDALRAQQGQTVSGSISGNGSETSREPDVKLSLPQTISRPEEIRVILQDETFLVQTRREKGEWITQKAHSTEAAAIKDAEEWYPAESERGAEGSIPSYVKALQDILGGKYDADTAKDRKSVV